MKFRLLFRVLKETAIDKIVLSYIFFMVVCSFILMFIEPQIKTFGDGIWYCFESFTTIGFGDIVAMTTVGKFITVFISLYGILTAAMTTGAIVNYYQETQKIKLHEITEEQLNKLEDLPNLSKEELADLSEKIKKIRKKELR